MNEKYLKEIATELRLIRQLLQNNQTVEINGEEFADAVQQVERAGDKVTIK